MTVGFGPTGRVTRIPSPRTDGRTLRGSLLLRCKVSQKLPAAALAAICYKQRGTKVGRLSYRIRSVPGWGKPDRALAISSVVDSPQSFTPPLGPRI